MAEPQHIVPLPQSSLKVMRAIGNLNAGPDEVRAIGMAAAVVLHFKNNRDTAEKFATLVIDLLDLIDEDPDLEDDDPSGQCDEDEVNTYYTRACGGGPGCALSDPPEDDDPPEDAEGGV